MTAKPTKAGSELLVQLLARETRGEVHGVPAAEFNQRTLQKLVDDGLVELTASLTVPEGRRAAAEVAHPTNPDAPA